MVSHKYILASFRENRTFAYASENLMTSFTERGSLNSHLIVYPTIVDGVYKAP